MYEDNTKKRTAHQLLNVVWGVLTALCLLLVLFFIWRNEQLETRQQLSYAAQQVSDRVDRLIDDLIQSVNKMPIHGEDYSDCVGALLPNMQRLVFNDQKIAGLVITNKKKQVICSTLPQVDNATILNNTASVALFGPVQTFSTDKPAFILQQQLGNYFIEIYILKSELEKQLETSMSFSTMVGLYNETQTHMMLQLERDSSKSIWLTSEPSQYISHNMIQEERGKTLVANNLINLKNMSVILKTDNQKLNQLAWRYVMMASIVILLLSFSIYYYLRRLIHQHFSLHRAIMNAIKSDDFFPVYQPVIDRRKNACCGAEVLLRWSANDQETIMPDSFIEYAEQSGLIVPITMQLAKKVFQEAQTLLINNPHFHLSINLSAIHFSDPLFFDDFIALCDEYEMPINQLMLEMTERDLLQDDVNLIRKMKELRQMGFSIAIDDFGTGHASISYLEHFPFNYLKIDRLFVRAIGTGAVTETLNQAIIHMAKSLDLFIIAEGVETYQQLETLEKHGVYFIQGWYFAKAMRFDKLKNFLKRNTR